MLNFFAKRAFLNTASNIEFKSKEESYKGYGHLQRVSSMIRADQTAQYLGARLNPGAFESTDVCIYVKPHVKVGDDFIFSGKAYLDIIDGWGLIPLLERHPEVGVIACSRQDEEKLKFILHNKVIFIPQHHCNFERTKRTRKGIKTVGVIGTEDAFEHLPKNLEKELNKRGIKLLKYSKFFSREDIVDFYKQIDIQIVWRPYRMKLSNPLKIVNAASFGIPTIAYNESVFEEVEGCYVGVEDLDDLLITIDVFRSDEHSLYYDLSVNCLETAEEYHIENVAKLYKKL